MKRKVIVLATTALVLLATGCGKEKTCRCAVQGSSKVRIVKIDGGKCTDLNRYMYHNEHEQQQKDVLVCTDYEFAIDSIFNNEE